MTEETGIQRRVPSLHHVCEESSLEAASLGVLPTLGQWELGSCSLLPQPWSPSHGRGGCYWGKEDPQGQRVGASGWERELLPAESLDKRFAARPSRNAHEGSGLVSPDTESASTQTVGHRSPKTVRNRCLLFKLPCPWYFVRIAPS